MELLTQRAAIIRIDHEKERVLLFVNGDLILNVEWKHALEVVKVLHSHAKLAEEYASRDTVIEQHAALMRVGAPIGLTANPEFIQAAGREAAWGKWRRYLPNRMKKGQEKVFGPTVKHKGK